MLVAKVAVAEVAVAEVAVAEPIVLPGVARSKTLLRTESVVLLLLCVASILLVGHCIFLLALFNHSPIGWLPNGTLQVLAVAVSWIAAHWIRPRCLGIMTWHRIAALGSVVAAVASMRPTIHVGFMQFYFPVRILL